MQQEMNNYQIDTTKVNILRLIIIKFFTLDIDRINGRTQRFPGRH